MLAKLPRVVVDAGEAVTTKQINKNDPYIVILEPAGVEVGFRRILEMKTK